MDLQLTSRRALVTGAAGGIGRAAVEALTAEGARVGAIDVDPRVRELVPSTAVADLTDAEAAAAAVEACARDLGGIDVVVLAAGISGPVGTPLDRTALTDWERVFAVNVTGAFLTLRSALPWLRRSDAPAVVVVASDSALVATAGMVPYAASKAALLQLARAAAVELAPEGIRVNAVCPSIVDTPMSRGDLGMPNGFAAAECPVQTPAEVADQIVLLASPRLRPVSAATWVSDFGVSARSGFPA
ncbi:MULTISPECIES: SDR family NAD(P)-dependent oxidoreductase [Microbacterium]|uniref:SDR family NAD(P)-dependent oxidoreductase n=1 Tax=Microbacterium TaxID=33882 RepID=UPI00277E772D|nr:MULTISPECIES: SDR family oxidoreductase [Microbacterium]MDQ1074079.1 NAD(P)-dependent dehydrogenase (short-subunit alcohol dehydrogenase family) [Microbacterium sp. SORGH_AS_0969]MDQ1114305.1 NAD(P)-dependent dehydrogenase (short-subunit alcohol dehydrogenase family) [Microbacterium testaceum]